ncbi:MAG TPA: 5'-methylthioadenosine/adenosylhomocysteine nucleosidase [Cyclobacteriaceae bacterium]
MNKILTLFFCCMLFASQRAHAQAAIDLNEARSAKLVVRKYKPVTGILGAFPEEIKFLLTQVQQKNQSIIQNITFTQGKLNGREVVIAQTGIGKVNAAIVSILMIEQFQPEEIIFTGIAGSINPDLDPGDLVIGTRIAHHDFGTITPDSLLRRPTRDPSTMIENPLYFKSDTSLVKMAINASKKAKFEFIKKDGKEELPHIITGTIVTGDVFVSSSTATENLRKKMNADATEMEGAAVAQVCWQQLTPFVIIRSISDNAGNSAYTDIKNFYQSAARNSAHLVMQMVKMKK